MVKHIFVNLPVKDLDASKSFFEKLGFSFNPQFTDESAACMVITDSIYAMLLTYNRFKDFTPKALVNAHISSEVLNALTVESREKVNELVDAALIAGASETRPPDDYGFMFARSFNDLDGHVWEIVWMDESQVQK